MRFNYQARDSGGATQTGVIEASSREAALSLLARRGLFVTLLEETGKTPFYTRSIRLFERVSLKDIAMFSRQLAIMVHSQVPLLEALQTLARQTKAGGFKEKLLNISHDVEAGTSLSQALSRYPDIFSSFYVNMVRSGEASGKLSEVIEKIAEQLEREYARSSTIKGAMVYPAFVVLLAVGVMFLLTYFVIPNLTNILQETGQELPAITKGVIAFTSFMRAWGVLVLAAIAGLVIAFIRYLKTKEGRKLWGRAVLRVPVFGSSLKVIFLSRFAENLATLIQGGIPIIQALEISGSIIGNTVYEQAVQRAKEAVSSGEPISRALERYPNEFPPLFTHMVFVGEKSGNLEAVLLNISSFYQKEVERTLSSLLSLLEPVLIVALGLGVGFLMVAIVLPLYQMSALQD